ncbi:MULTISPECIES: DUF2399 domain-containing protein [unclassified Nonomuraea]|uniref:DUF2399 domain-containing protein n=1 Tax=unclassified Nonomuraea TaxID=2593643 RepID=UPI003409A716
MSSFCSKASAAQKADPPRSPRPFEQVEGHRARAPRPTYERLLNCGESEPLRGSGAGNHWDPGLAARMRAGGRAVMEERLIDELVRDLRRPGAR